MGLCGPKERNEGNIMRLRRPPNVLVLIFANAGWLAPALYSKATGSHSVFEPQAIWGGCTDEVILHYDYDGQR